MTAEQKQIIALKAKARRGIRSEELRKIKCAEKALKDKARSNNLTEDQKKIKCAEKALKEKDRMNNLTEDQKNVKCMLDAIRKSNCRHNTSREERLASNKKSAERISKQRSQKQGNFTLDQPEDMPDDEYLNSFESNPIAAQVFM